MTSVIARIILRYLAGALIAKGFLSPDLGNTIVADPEIETMIQVGLGLVIGGATELFYFFARRFGWAK